MKTTQTFCYALIIFQISCVAPQKPEFDFKEGLVYIDAFASTLKGESYVNLYSSGYKFNKFSNIFISGASVNFRNTITNAIIALIEENDIYLPPNDFCVSEGESWELLVSLPNGQNYQSSTEIVEKSVGFSGLKSVYSTNLIFREGSNDFLPGHYLSLDIEDPPNEKNFYYWRFRSFEDIDVCQTEMGTYLLCDSQCWKIRFNENIKVFSDEFNDGGFINALPVADVPLYSKKNIVVQIHQYSISQSAYSYFKVIKDIVDDNSGINAPPPSVFSGNIFNPGNDKEFVLGRFTVASTTFQSIFIDRFDILEDPILRTPNYDLLPTPCSENRFRTSITPVGWEN